jgi:hypothetical protein
VNGLDWFLAVLVVVFAVTGWTQGFVVGLLSFVGFAGGTIVGLLLVPRLLGGLEPGVGTAILAVGLVLIMAVLLQGLLSWVGNRLRDRVGSDHAKVVDAAGGMVLAVTGLLVAAWAVGVVAASSGIPGFARLARESTVLATVDEYVPIGPERLRDTFRDVVEAGGFPEVVAPFVPEPDIPTEPPTGTLGRTAEIRQAANSVVKVLGQADACGVNLEGSGFAVAADRIMTNAHVVAGTRRVVVVRPGAAAEPLEATVVYLDPRIDVALLAVDGLDLPVLDFVAPAEPGADAAAVGYPNNGPLRSTPVRVRGTVVLLGQDIYGADRVRREVIAVRGSVQPGNSGGPLVSTDGQVYGMVFASSLTDDETGYALTPAELEPAMTRVGLTDEVGTGACAR